jgi:hypothetical protein
MKVELLTNELVTNDSFPSRQPQRPTCARELPPFCIANLFMVIFNL